MDEADQADANHEAEEELRKLQLQRRVVDKPREDGLCIDCEGEVEAGRVRLGLARCITCQQVKERTWVHWQVSGRRRAGD